MIWLIVNMYALMVIGKQFYCSSFHVIFVHRASEEQSSGWMSYVGKAIMNSASYLPSNVSHQYCHIWIQAHINADCAGVRRAKQITWLHSSQAGVLR